ncbi:MAG: hypothetical protein E6180_08750, partial [Varibaculum cambriense]|nr:hypothetical protein [Varibaculum cambriense]
LLRLSNEARKPVTTESGVIDTAELEAVIARQQEKRSASLEPSTTGSEVPSAASPATFTPNRAATKQPSAARPLASPPAPGAVRSVRPVQGGERHESTD